MGNEGLAIVGVSGEDKNILDAAPERFGIEYPIARTPVNPADSAFEITAYPTTLLIDAEGRVAWRGHPFDLQEEWLLRELERAKSLQESQ